MKEPSPQPFSFTWVLRPVEAALNRGIESSSTAQAAFARVAGRVLAIDLADLGLSITIRCADERLVLESEPADRCDARIRGTVLSFLGMFVAEDSEQRAGRVVIEGDADVAQHFRDLLRLAIPDPEEELSRVVGDVAAHQIGRAARGALDWGRKAFGTLGDNLSEYVQEETRTVVSRTELDEFVSGVDRLREAVDRLDARVRKLG